MTAKLWYCLREQTSWEGRASEGWNILLPSGVIAPDIRLVGKGGPVEDGRYYCQVVYCPRQQTSWQGRASEGLRIKLPTGVIAPDSRLVGKEGPVKDGRYYFQVV